MEERDLLTRRIGSSMDTPYSKAITASSERGELMTWGGRWVGGWVGGWTGEWILRVQKPLQPALTEVN